MLPIHNPRVSTRPLCASNSQTFICLSPSNNPWINIHLLSIHSPRVSTYLLCASSSQTIYYTSCPPQALRVGTYSIVPWTIIRLLSTCSPWISICLLYLCRTPLVGMYTLSSEVNIREPVTYNHRTNVHPSHPHGHWIPIHLPCPHSHRCAPRPLWGRCKPFSVNFFFLLPNVKLL